jgi:osmotically-inducible protein OsmY
MDDKKLRRNVLEELDFEPSVDAANIGVAVEDGIVTLTGHVKSFAEKVVVEEAVRRISGVRGIAEKIEVRFLHNKKLSDDEIASRVLNVLKWSEILPDGEAQVTVENGWVTLSGRAPWQFQKAAAEKAVRKLSGIVGITNRISIAPTISGQDVKNKIEKALTRRLQSETQGIKVTVNDGNIVRLEGKVQSWNDRLAVEDAAWSVPGVHSVDDRISIGPL